MSTDYDEVVQTRKDLVKQWVSQTLLRAGSNGISVSKVAEAMGVSESLVYKLASPAEEANQIHVHNLIPFLATTGDYLILHELVKIFGFALVPMGEPVEMVRSLLKALERK